MEDTVTMISGKRVIALTPARGSSKSVRQKNIQLLGDKPLICWPISCAIQTPEIDRIIVSTDDQLIAKFAKDSGAEIYERPAELAADTSLVADTIRHLWNQLNAEGETAEIMVLLEATSPFRSPSLIRRCLERLINENLDSIATFNDANLNPERAWRIEEGMPRPYIPGAIAWKPRQSLTPAYQLNGAVYAFYPDRLPREAPNILFGNIGAEIVPVDTVIDIDTKKDLVIANALLKS
jgi:CMP-N,N'-diacetyllegionaminic acid synthase